MATTTLNTRILLKYDSYENWLTNNPVLKKGELAIAYLDQEHATEATNFQNIPNVVLKVGDGTNPYKALKFVSGLAADVYSWAKAPTRPEYEAKDIKGLSDYIAGEIEDTDTQYTIVKVTDYQYKLQSKAKGEASFSDTGVVIDLPNDTAAITALQNKFEGMTEATVVAHVAAEIAKLGIADYAKKTEVQAVATELTNYKTSNDAAVKKVGDDLAAYQTSNDAVIAAIKDHDTVDSFGDVMTEMAKYQLAGDYATKTEAQGYATAAANGKDAAIKAAQDAANQAQSEVDAVELRVDALETHKTDFEAKVNTLVGEDANKSVRTIAAEEAAKKDQAIADALKAGQDAQTAANAAQADVDAVELDLGNVDSLSTENKTVVGAINEVLAAVGTGGTAAVVTMTADTTTDGMAKSYTIKQGTTTVGVIDIPKDMVVESGSVVVNPEGQAEGTYIKLVLANATNDELYINVGTLVDIYKAQASAAQVQLAIDSSTREISASIVAGSITSTELAANSVITEKIADGNVTKAKLSSAVQASLDKAEAAATAADLDAAELRLDAIEELLGDGEGSVADQIATAKQEAIDTAAGDATSKANTAKSEAISEANAYTDGEIDKLGDMAMESKADYVAKSEAPGYDDILTKTAAAEAYEPIGSQGKAEAAAKAYTDQQINGLAAVAKSGNVKDLVQDENSYIIFDCGTSSTVI